MCSLTKVALAFVLVTDTYKQLTHYINYIRNNWTIVYREYQKSKKGKIKMSNKRVKVWKNVDKLYAEYKQVIQKSRIECLKGIVYICCRRKCKSVSLSLLE